MCARVVRVAILSLFMRCLGTLCGCGVCDECDVCTVICVACEYGERV